MNKGAYHILRVGCGVTYFWIAVLIIKNPMEWGLLMQPWVINLLPVPVNIFMFGIAGLDLLIGFLLLIESRVWLVALLGALQFIAIFISIGVTEITIRDIGLLSAVLALLWQTKPAQLLFKKKNAD